MIDHRPREVTLDSAISCAGLIALIFFVFCAAWIWVFWQVVPWLTTAQWSSYPLSKFLPVEIGWLGLQKILDWLLALPVTLVFVGFGLFLFALFGKISARVYEYRREVLQTATPDQSKA